MGMPSSATRQRLHAWQLATLCPHRRLQPRRVESRAEQGGTAGHAGGEGHAEGQFTAVGGGWGSDIYSLQIF